MIGIEHLAVRFGSVTAVDGVSLEIPEGEWLTLIGANGAGKTSLLRAIAQLERYEGAVRVGDQLLSALPPRRRARLVAYLPQSPQVPADMSVLDYVLLGRTPHIGYFGVETEHDRTTCVALLDRLEMSGFRDRKLSAMSGGELQRVLICRALAQEAPVLLLDEPTSALDLGRRVDALELVDKVRSEHALTVVSAMHDLTLAAQFSDRVALLSHGSVAACGSATEVLTEDLLSVHFGGPVRVYVADDGELIVAPRRHGRSFV